MVKNWFPEETIEQIRVATDIVEVVSQHVSLKKTGANFKGLCPFHNEKTPSFTVSPDKQIFHCFGCGEGGNVFVFLMKADNLSFQDTVTLLASRSNIVLDQQKNGPWKKKSENVELKDHIYSLNKNALLYFQSVLHKTIGKTGGDYFLKRGIDREEIKLFSLGYSPPLWDGLIKYFERKNFNNTDLLLKAGLIKKKTKGRGFYDVFRDRVIFPIFDPQSRVVGFGGRTIKTGDNSFPKYLNTPETPIYHKGKILYGLHLSKDAIRSQGNVIIVEGYLDFITLYSHGIKNVIATLGTALTVDQVHLIKRYAREAIIVFDGDQAGEKATERGYRNIMASGGLQVRVISLPKGSDPDSYLREQGTKPFLEKISSASSYIEFIIDSTINKIKKSTQHENKFTYINTLLPFLADIPNAIERSSYVTYLSEKIGLSSIALHKEMEKALIQGKKRINSPRITIDKETKKTAEFLLLQIVLNDLGRIGDVKKMLNPEDFEDPQLFTVAKFLFEEEKAKLSFSDLGARLHNKETGLAETISRLSLENMEFDNVDQAMNDCIKKIQKKKYRTQFTLLMKKRKKAASLGIDNKDEYARLQTEFNRLKEKLS